MSAHRRAEEQGVGRVPTAPTTLLTEGKVSAVSPTDCGSVWSVLSGPFSRQVRQSAAALIYQKKEPDTKCQPRSWLASPVSPVFPRAVD